MNDWLRTSKYEAKKEEDSKRMLRSGVEPEPTAWKAVILPLDQRSWLIYCVAATVLYQPKHHYVQLGIW